MKRPIPIWIGLLFFLSNQKFDIILFDNLGFIDYHIRPAQTLERRCPNNDMTIHLVF